MCTNAINAFTGHDVETATIWLPDFDVANEIDGLQSLSSFTATVYSDGTVRWERSGGITVFCAYRGLAAIPFDTMGCQLIFGAKNDRRTNVQYELEFPEVMTFGPFDVTYNEWGVVPELSEHVRRIAATVPFLNLYFQRATRYYLQNIVTPIIILTYLSFFTFLLDLRIGERVGFGMALALVIVAQQIVTSGLSPVSNQRLWLDKFVGFSFYWVIAGVIQSVIIGFLYYVREDRNSRLEQEKDDGETEPFLGNIENGANDQETVLPQTPSKLNPLESIKTVDHNENDRQNDSTLNELAVTDSNNISKDETQSTERCCEGCLYTISFRRIDLISLAIAFVTYTIFVILMFITVQSTDSWLRNEPTWFGESDAFSLSNTKIYNATDPNSR
jgi:hypothetical protein